jgi:signal transduction histidine kinase
LVSYTVGSGDRDTSGIMPAWIQESYLIKFVLAIVIVTAGIGVVGVAAYDRTATELDQEVQSQLLNSVAQEAEAVENWQAERGRLARMLSEYEVMNQSDPSVISFFLSKEIKNLPPDILHLWIVDVADGEIVTGNGPAEIVTDADATEPPWLTNESLLTADDDIYTKTDVYRTSGVPVQAFTTPIPNERDRVLVLSARVDSIAEEFRPPVNGSVTHVVDENNRILVDTHQGATLEPYRHDASGALADGRTGGTGFLREENFSRDHEEKQVLAYAGVGSSEWVVLTHAPVDEVFSLRNTVTQNLLAILAVSILGLGMIAATIGRNTVTALNTISRKAQALEEGSYDVDLSTNRADEIGDVFAAFSNMRDALRDRIDQLEATSREERNARQRLAKSKTQLEEQQAIVSVLNRLLTHNLRNGLVVVLGRADFLIDELSGERREHAETIERRASQLYRRTQKAMVIEQVVTSEDTERERVDLVEVIEEEVRYIDSQYSAATVTTDLPIRAPVLADRTLGFAVENLLENAIQHNDREDPSVDITVDVDGSTTSLRIADNGPGIPEGELAALRRGFETQLEHGTGIGLWAVNWLIENIDGSVAFEDREPKGTVVTVSLETSSR